MNALARLGMLSKMTLVVSTAIAMVSCSNASLDKTPAGVLSAGQVTTPSNLDGLVTAAYSWLGNDHYTDPNYFWATGDIRGGDAHKGGNGPGDVYYYHLLTMYNLVVPTAIDIDGANRYWVRWYDGISRVNTALSVVNVVSATDYPNKTGRTGELHFLRGVYYFWLKLHFDRIPWIDENTSPSQVVSNVALSSQQVWDNIIADFRTAVADLPKTQAQVGRANYYAAEAYLAKALLYAAYVQDPTTHTVMSMDTAKLSEVVSLVTDIEASGQYGLMPDYAQNFLPQYDNNMESIFAIQRSVNDGSAQGNGGRGTFSSALNYPVGNSGFGCCGFHIPSQDFINSFKTQNGLPIANYNAGGSAADYASVQDPATKVITAGTLGTQAVDPRLHHSIAMAGMPFKYCTSSGPTCIHDGINWARDPTTYGSTIGVKDLVSRDSSALVLNGPFFISSMNTVLIRYADVELFKAEAMIELNAGDLGLSIINSLRTRAAASTGLLNTNANAVAHFVYDVQPYAAFANQTAARQALRTERRLELGLEGFRFFDLVRWGVAAQTIGDINSPGTYLGDELLRRPYLAAAKFTAGRDEYLPIPQAQIDLSGGVYVQNPGY